MSRPASTPPQRRLNPIDEELPDDDRPDAVPWAADTSSVQSAGWKPPTTSI